MPAIDGFWVNLMSTPLIVVAVLLPLALVISKTTGETGPAASGLDEAVTLSNVPVVSDVSDSETTFPVAVVEVKLKVPDV